MKTNTLLLSLLLFLLAGAVPSREAQAALWWAQGVHDRDISVCFVGDAVTKRPDRVQEILDAIKRFEYVANIQFDYLGVCPASIPDRSGNDSFAGDIRVLIPGISGIVVDGWTGESGTGPVPGQGCPMFLDENGSYNGDNDGWGSWSNSPADLGPNRACMYNLKLGDDPWNDTPYLNHTLHEFGHALGLAHEHARSDANAGCTKSSYGPNLDKPATGGFMTAYDRDSVMHYKFDEGCDIPGNYGRNGLSDMDRLALHILYPEENRVAEFVGKRVISSSEPLSLRSAWKLRGANMDFVVTEVEWRLNGVSRSSSPDLYIEELPAGEYTLEYRYEDFLGREYSYSGTIQVLEPAAYRRRIGSAVAASAEAMAVTLDTTSITLAKAGGLAQLAPNVLVTVEQEDFKDALVLNYRPADDPGTPDHRGIGLVYELTAVDALTGEGIVPQRGQSYQVAIGYDAGQIPGHVDESTLALYSWQNGGWEKETSSVVDPESDTVTATPNHFSLWAVLGDEEPANNQTFLPFIVNR